MVIAKHLSANHSIKINYVGIEKCHKLNESFASEYLDLRQMARQKIERSRALITSPCIVLNNRLRIFLLFVSPFNIDRLLFEH